MVGIMTLLLGMGCATRKHEPPMAAVGLEDSATFSLPEFTLSDLTGQSHASATWVGRPVLLDFWATWCAACRHTHPEINRIHATYRDRGLHVIGINLDKGDRDKVAAYCEAMNLAYPVLLDPEDTVSPRLRVETLPTVMLFDAEGEGVGAWVGGGASEQKALQEAVRNLMGED